METCMIYYVSTYLHTHYTKAHVSVYYLIPVGTYLHTYMKAYYVTVHEQIRHNALKPPASANLKQHISRTLQASELILGTAIEVGVVYLQTGNESHSVSGCGITCN